jgi:hypothetical protein
MRRTDDERLLNLAPVDSQKVVRCRTAEWRCISGKAMTLIVLLAFVLAQRGQNVAGDDRHELGHVSGRTV